MAAMPGLIDRPGDPPNLFSLRAGPQDDGMRSQEQTVTAYADGAADSAPLVHEEDVLRLGSIDCDVPLREIYSMIQFAGAVPADA
jgi:hypothetical protein